MIEFDDYLVRVIQKLIDFSLDKRNGCRIQNFFILAKFEPGSQDSVGEFDLNLSFVEFNFF